MGLIKFNKIGISGISAAVPKNIIDNYTFKGLFTNKEIENIIKTTGIVERRFASKDICSSDLCVLSAEKLLTEMNVDRESIDVLIFITQTPDYLQPATAPRIQHRLKLSKNTASFDINMAVQDIYTVFPLLLLTAILKGLIAYYSWLVKLCQK